MKKIIIIAIIAIGVFFTYLLTLDREVYYLALGDSLAVGTNAFGEEVYGYTDYVSDFLEEKGKLELFLKEYATNGYRTIDIINDINSNKSVRVNNKEITLKNALVKADLVTLSIGSNDFLNNIRYSDKDSREYITQVMNDINDLFTLLRQYCKEDIVVIGYYNPFYYLSSMSEDLEYANELLKALANNYDIEYVEISDLFQNNTYLPNPLDIHPSKEGYLKISERVIAKINSILF